MSETVASPAEEEAGRFTCPLCPARFESIGDKRRHLRSKHSATNSGGRAPRRARRPA